MTDGDLLLRAILADPREDTPRLAYADWLDEHGEPRGHLRGEFIRYQLAYAWHAEEGGDPFAGDARSEYPLSAGVWPFEEWPDSMYALWARGLSAADADRSGIRWRRGFVDRIELPCAAFLTHAEAIFRAHPVTEVRLVDKTPHVWREGRLVTYSWYVDVPIAEPRLPREFFLPDQLAADCPSAERALAWASRRAVEYGRKCAGLPPLPGD